MAVASVADQADTVVVMVADMVADATMVVMVDTAADMVAAALPWVTPANLDAALLTDVPLHSKKNGGLSMVVLTITMDPVPVNNRLAPAT